jgi:ABC-type sugar transport system substrate-binding protein
MKKAIRAEVFLVTQENDYQLAQASDVEDAARRLGVQINISFAHSDSVEQSQQVLRCIQSKPEDRPDAIILAAVGKISLPQVAHAAADEGIGWAVLNQAEYIGQLRTNAKAPTFCVVPDNLEVGRIEGRQIGALLPNGGTVLYIQGPGENVHSSLRNVGMYETKPPSLQVRGMRASEWTEASAFRSVTNWLQLSTSQKAHIDLVAAQNDVMAVGAKRAFEEFSETDAPSRWTDLPFLGVDGVPKTGQAWVRSGLLTATVIQPPTAGRALEMMIQALRTGVPPQELTLMPVHSFPEVESLALSRMRKKAAGAR